ncbi:hypothetical protein ABIC44_001149 [Sphingomonas sp. 1185]
MGKGAACCLLLSAPPRRRPGSSRGTGRATHQCPPNWIPAFAGMVGGADSGMTCLDISSGRGVFGALGAGRVFPWPSTSLRLNGVWGMGMALATNPFALSEVEVHAPTSRKQPRPTRQTDLTYRNSPRYGGNHASMGKGAACCLLLSAPPRRRPGSSRGTREATHQCPPNWIPAFAGMVCGICIDRGRTWVGISGRERLCRPRIGTGFPLAFDFAQAERSVGDGNGLGDSIRSH